jgi:hypothetical protein
MRRSMIFLLLMAATMLGIIFNAMGKEASAFRGEQIITINVDAKDNCFLLDNTNAKGMLLTPGTYMMTSSGNARYEPGLFFKNILMRHRNIAEADSTIVLSIGSNDMLDQGGPNPPNRYLFYAMLVDWADTTDNSGSVVLDLNGNPLTVDARSNCLILTPNTAVLDTIPAGTYTVEFSGNAGIPTPFTEVVIHYKGINGDVTDIVKKGIPKQISLRSGNPNIAVFFLDWAFLSDNIGVGVVSLTPTESIPTLSEWGLIIFGVVLLGFITWVFVKKRKVIGIRI